MNETGRLSSTTARSEVIGAFMRGVYNWMAAGLGLTAIAAYLTASSETLMNIVFGQPIFLILLIVAELGLVVSISAGIRRMSAGTATLLFVIYSLLNGVTLSSILVVYTGTSIVTTFVVCSGMFVTMSVYGMTTKKDLTSWGSFLFMGLVGIILAALVNMFLRSSLMEFVISGVGVIVFLGLTAYDTQKLRQMGASAPVDDQSAVQKGTILGALSLYLDFINMFLLLLHLFGQVRE
jgi:hypothetical protein